MAGFREFQTGEVLTAANVNDYLAKQAVMKFADASARDTALGTAVGGGNALREGMVTYLDDTDEVLFYDGTAWGPVGLPLGTATPTDGQVLAYGTATSTWNPTDQIAGIGTNVVSVNTTTATGTTSTSFVDTSMAATITPTSATSKVLVIAQAEYFQNTATGFQAEMALYRGNTSGTQLSSRTETYFDAGATERTGASLLFLDSPATTSATTYTVGIRTAGAASTAQVFGQQNIVLIEVAV